MTNLKEEKGKEFPYLDASQFNEGGFRSDEYVDPGSITGESQFSCEGTFSKIQIIIPNEEKRSFS